MARRTAKPNLILIGMPAAGKSTIGTMLAEATSRGFVDTDALIQAQHGATLQDIIDREGRHGFCRIEEESILSLACRGHVIATGGSAVYSERAMAHLKAGGTIVYLALPTPALEARLANLATRGIVMPQGETIAVLQTERRPLYERYAEVTIHCEGKTDDQVVAEIARAVDD